MVIVYGMERGGGRLTKGLLVRLEYNYSRGPKPEEERVSAEVAQREAMTPKGFQVGRLDESTSVLVGTRHRRPRFRSIALVKEKARGRTRTNRITTKAPSADLHLPLRDC